MVTPHLLRRYIAEILVITSLVAVLAGSAWLLGQAYRFQANIAEMIEAAVTAPTGNIAENAAGAAHGIYLSSDSIHKFKAIVQSSSILIAALFLLCAMLLWYCIHHRALLARAAEIRKKSHERYRFLTEGPPTIGIVRFSLVDFKLLDCNRAALNITGMPRSEFVGRPLTDFIDGRDLAFVKLELQELRSCRSSHYFTVKMPHYHGGCRHIAWHISVMKLLDEEPQAVAILTDVSKEHEVHLERMEKERLAGVLQMAGAAAHELNQPMQVISGLLWMLLKKLDEKDPSRKTLRTIYAEVERMTAISRKIANIGSYEIKDYVGETKIIDIDRAAEGQRRHKG